MTFRLLQGIALCLLGAMHLAQAQTADLPAPVWKGLQYPADVLMDVTGQQSLADVQAGFERGDFQPVKGNATQPLGGVKTAWFRIKLPNVTSQTPAVLTVSHPGIDSVVLYTSAADGAWQAHKSGDSVPVAQWPLPHLYPAFLLEVSPADARPVYMKVRHTAPVGVNWQLWDKPSFDKENINLHVLIGGYLGMILLVVLLSCLNAANWRDPIHLVYAIHVLLVGGAMLSLAGVPGQYFWPDNAWLNDRASFVIPTLSAGWAALLVQRILAERGNYWASRLLISVMVLACMLPLAFTWMAPAGVFHAVNFFLLYFFAVTTGSLIWFSVLRPRIGLWALAGLLCMFLAAAFPILRNLNLLSTWTYTQYAPTIGAALEIPLVLVALYFRSRERRDYQLRLSALSRVDPLTGVTSQRLLLERLEHLLQRHERDPQMGAVLRVRLANREAIQSEGGVEALNAALIRAGACAVFPTLQSDTVGRYLDRDFVVLLEGKTSEAFVADISQRIVAKGLTYIFNSPGGAGLQLHVACADASMLKEEPLALLARLGALLDDMTNQPAKQIKFLREKHVRRPITFEDVPAN